MCMAFLPEHGNVEYIESVTNCVNCSTFPAPRFADTLQGCLSFENVSYTLGQPAHSSIAHHGNSSQVRECAESYRRLSLCLTKEDLPTRTFVFVSAPRLLLFKPVWVCQVEGHPTPGTVCLLQCDSHMICPSHLQYMSCILYTKQHLLLVALHQHLLLMTLHARCLAGASHHQSHQPQLP